MNFENLEVLSPAGDAESFYAALNNGADAIYLGLNNFNARMRAENFSKENIREFISLAHSFGVKIYITINTLLNDDDFDELVSLVKVLTNAKADAFIVQDLGVAHVLKTCFKNITLHASTQMGIHNLEGALVAEKLGFKRIVLSRETTLKDIEEIHKNTNLEIEYFVQGALCVAFSGNCYLSSIENGLSGNEGKCLQLCRLPYLNSKTDETKYYLSPRDLSLLENLPALIKAGVTSFKIEGRMKHSGYVAICTKMYKTAINLIKNNNFDNKFLSEANQILQKTFSRGEFNKNAYLTKNIENNIINYDFQNHIGIKIGKIESSKPFKENLYQITISSSHEIASGDGLKFIDKEKNQIASIGVGDVQKLENNLFKLTTKHKLLAGLNAYLIQDKKLEEKYLNIMRKIPITLNIIAKKCEKIKITATANHNRIFYESKEILQPANSSPLSTDDIKSQFSKTGETIFEIENIEVQTDGIFAPKSMLNNIRRTVLEIVQENLIDEREKYLNVEFLDNEYQKQKLQKPIINSQNLNIIDDNNENLSEDTINIISPNNYAEFLFSIKNINIMQENMALFLPIITSFDDKKIVNKIIEALPTNYSLFVNNIGGLYYKIFQNKNIIISPLLNIKNKFALLALNNLGITQICASIEATSEFIDKHNLISFSDGYFPLMTFAHCPIKTIYNSSCKTCKYSSKLSYTSQSKQVYNIHRTQISNCYFYLMKKLSKKNGKYSLKNLKQH